MLVKTHYVISVFFIFLLIPLVNDQVIFVITTLIATALPDIDTKFSSIGRRKINRILQLFTKHRGMFHSFTFLLILTIVFVLFWPVIAFGFFLGYGLHLLVDSFTRSGIRPFYPWKKKSKGIIRTGGRLEIVVFVVFLIVDIGLMFNKIF